MRHLQLSLIALLILILAVGLIWLSFGCTNTADEIKSYVHKVWLISMRGRMLAGEAQRTFAAMGEDEMLKLGSAISHDYSEKYTRLLQDLASLESPEECYRFGDYMRDYLTYSSRLWTECQLAFSSADKSHLNQAESYAADASMALALAYGEGERLGEQYDFDPIDDVTVAGEQNHQVIGASWNFTLSSNLTDPAHV